MGRKLINENIIEIEYKKNWILQIFNYDGNYRLEKFSKNKRNVKMCSFSR